MFDLNYTRTKVLVKGELPMKTTKYYCNEQVNTTSAVKEQYAEDNFLLVKGTIVASLISVLLSFFGA